MRDYWFLSRSLSYFVSVYNVLEFVILWTVVPNTIFKRKFIEFIELNYFKDMTINNDKNIIHKISILQFITSFRITF